MPKLEFVTEFPCGYKSRSTAKSWYPLANLTLTNDPPAKCPLHGENCTHNYEMGRLMLCDECLSEAICEGLCVELGFPEVIYDGIKMHLRKSVFLIGEEPKPVCGLINEHILSFSAEDRSKLAKVNELKY